MDTPAEQPARRRRRRIASAFLYVALLAAGVLLALWLHRRIWDQADDSAPLLPDRRVLRAEPGGPAATSSRPAAGLPDSLPAGGPRPLKGDPTGIAPPAGARLCSAFRMPDGSVQVAYRLAGGPDAVARHYIEALKRAGYSALGDRRWRRGRRLVFARGRSGITVGLRKDARNARMVRVVVTVLALGGRRPTH